MKIVPTVQQQRQYPLIVRVVIDKQVHHYAEVIRCVEAPQFSISVLRQVFRVRSDEEWIVRPARDWKDAMTALAWGMQTAPADVELSSSGFFITIRPIYGEIEVLHQRYDALWTPRHDAASVPIAMSA